MDKKTNLEWRISQKKNVLDSMSREFGKSHGGNQAADADRIRQVKNELADLKRQLAEADRQPNQKSDFLPTKSPAKKAPIAGLGLNPIIEGNPYRMPSKAQLPKPKRDQVASSFLPQPRVTKPEQPKKPTGAELGLNPIVTDGAGWLKTWRSKQEDQDNLSTFLPPEETKKPSVTDLGLNPIVIDAQGWKQAWYRKQESDEKAKKKGPYQFDTASIFNVTTDLKDPKPDGWLYGTNSGVESEPEPAPKPLVPTLKNTKEIALGTRYGKVTITAPAWKDMSLDEKVQFKNWATREAETHFGKQGYKPFRGPTLPLTLPSEHTPYTGDFMTDLKTAEGMADGVTKVAKSLLPISQADKLSGGRITKLIRSVADKIKVVPDKPDDPDVPWAGKILESLIEPGHIIDGLLNYPSTIVDSAADVVDPNVGAVRTGLGAANLIPFVRGAGKYVSKGRELFKSLKPSRPIVLPPDATFHPSLGAIPPKLPRPIQEVKAILQGHEPVPPSRSISPWRQQNLARYEELKSMPKGGGISRRGSGRNTGSAGLPSTVHIESIARLGIERAAQGQENLFSAIRSVGRENGIPQKWVHIAAYNFARKNGTFTHAPKDAYLNPDVLREFQRGLTDHSSAVIMADAASVNEFYHNPATGAKGDKLSGGGPGLANKVLDPRRFDEGLAWALMREHDAWGVIKRAGMSKLIAAYKAFSPDTILGSHGYMAVVPEMKAAGMTMSDLENMLALIKRGRPNALNWKAIEAERDISKIFDPQWSTFQDRINLYKVLFDGDHINYVHWLDVADILESPVTKGYAPGDLMNVVRVGDEAVLPGDWHDVYKTGIPGRNEGLFPGNLNIQELFGSQMSNRELRRLVRSLQMGGKYRSHADMLKHAIEQSKQIHSGRF